MCEPISIAAATLAISAAATSYGYVQQSEQADAQNEAIEDNYERTRQEAVAAFERDTTDIARRQVQEQDAAAQQREQFTREYDAVRAQTVTSAGERGIAGLSLDALLGDLAGQQATRLRTTNDNLNMTLQQLQREKESAGFAAQSRVNSVNRTPVAGPSLVGLGLTIAGQAVNAAGQYQTARTQQKILKAQGAQ